MVTNKKKGKTKTIYISEEEEKAILKKAKAQKRSFSNYVIYAALNFKE